MLRHSARLVTRALVLGCLGLGLMGMGGFGGGRDQGLPARDFKAVLTDVDGNRMEVTRVTAGGDVSLEGELGRGRLRVPFDNIARITFKAADERDRVHADVQLREGEPVVLSVRSSTTFYGKVPGGAYQIRARDLKTLELVQ
jgi:hypothetical protein